MKIKMNKWAWARALGRARYLSYIYIHSTCWTHQGVDRSFSISVFHLPVRSTRFHSIVCGSYFYFLFFFCSLYMHRYKGHIIFICPFCSLFLCCSGCYCYYHQNKDKKKKEMISFCVCQYSAEHTKMCVFRTVFIQWYAHIIGENQVQKNTRALLWLMIICFVRCLLLSLLLLVSGLLLNAAIVCMNRKILLPILFPGGWHSKKSVKITQNVMCLNCVYMSYEMAWGCVFWFFKLVQGITNSIEH